MTTAATIEETAESAAASRRRASRRAWGLSAAATAVWFAAVAATRSFPRVLNQWETTVTMIFGSFLAGSSPEGGGAVAFPVLTKALEVPAPIARTFGLCIQAVGMSMAVVAILLYRRRIHARAAIIGSIAAVVGFLGWVALVGESDKPFWPASISTGWVKASFSIVLATTSIMMVRHLRQHQVFGPSVTHNDDLAWTDRFTVIFVLFALVGGMLSALTGTGANILVFLFLVVLAGTNPKTALPTAIVVMTAVSIVGFVLFGLIDGQLDVDVVGDRVTSVGGQPTDLPADRTDLLGLWLAAVPVVVWGAPLGSLVAARVRESWLVTFVAILAAVEVVTTFWLVDELRTDALLFTYLVLGLTIVPTSLVLLRRYRAQLFGMPEPISPADHRAHSESGNR